MRNNKRILAIIRRWFAWNYLPWVLEKIGINRQLGFIQNENNIYCIRCDSCGYDECCPAEICDNGNFCGNLYGTKPQRLQTIADRDPFG